MKIANTFKAGMVCLVCAAGALIWSGCDTASADEELVVTPSSVALSSGESQLFTVSGGYHYTWSLLESVTSTSTTTTTTSVQGHLSSLTGSEVRYFAPSGAGLKGTVTLEVRSTIPGTAGSSTNSSEYSVTGKAIITFK